MDQKTATVVLPSADDLAARIRAFMAADVSRGPATDETFAALALDVFRHQFAGNPAYAKFCQLRGASPANVRDWRDVPALPTAAFKETEVTSLQETERIAVFHSSGTTGQETSRHFHSKASLALYEASLLSTFREHFLNPGADDEAEERFHEAPPGFIFLTPPPAAVPHSSLVHMFETVRGSGASRDSAFTGKLLPDGSWTLDMETTLFAIRKSMCANRPIALLGTAFNWVHLLEQFAANNRRYRLAAGSRALETGGYKGRSREVPRAELHGLITWHLGIPTQRIVTEYGMSELSSQAYAASGAPLQFPPWCRARIISPETGRPVQEGETGLVRLFDLANLWSVSAVQTSDLAVARGAGFEHLGRAPAAEPRGCSLMTALP